jgi:ATP-dependent helicase/nuclease subunit B
VLPVPRRHFLPWDRPLLPSAVAFLAGNWRGPEPLDLSRVLVLVPTRQSGRRLREALAEHAAARQSAVFAPRVLTPQALVSGFEQPGAATRMECLLAWTDVLRAIAPADFREVFPVNPPARSFSWALRLAEQFARLQAALAENALRIADVGVKAGDFPEIARWRQLASLEQLWLERLRREGRSSPYVVATAEAPAWTEGVDRVVVIATVDPWPAATAALEACLPTLPPDVLVFAPDSLADAFDAWGRPIAAVWTKRTVELADFERRVHLCADPSEQAGKIAALAQAYATRGSPDGWLAIGVADPEIAPLAEGEMARAGVPLFNPEGRPYRMSGLFHLLSALADIARAPTFDAVEAFARCPEFLAYAAPEGAAGAPTAERLLADLDDLRKRHLPPDLAAARRHARGDLAVALAAIEEVRAVLTNGAFAPAVATVLERLLASPRGSGPRAEDEPQQTTAAAWADVLDQCTAAGALFGRLETADWWEIALRAFGEGRGREEKQSDAVELQGWLELLFEAAPHLIVAGLNDGFVPEAVRDDAFLPESLRARLGLTTNGGRFARDAYLLQAMAACRAQKGRIDITFGKTTDAGDPLRPSRLLLRCEDADLPARIAFLFRTPQALAAHLPWRRAWRLRPRPVAPPTQVAVTALRRWLACPFRFYLHTALRMEPVDAAKSEMDAFDFGTLCHAAFEAMGREPALRDCTDAAVLREFLGAQLERHARARYGAELSLPLLIQVESARQRLGKLADLQARQRAEGWVIEAVEQPFTVEIAGLVLRGKIDRIDRHTSTGAARVLDYKTSDVAIMPRAAHLRPARADETAPEWARVAIDDKIRVWTDLQLPLYRQALAPTLGHEISCGYINLPKAIGQTALTLWDDYSPELHAAAVRCAEGIGRAIQAGEFWPPNETIRPESDDFAPLFHRGVADSVEWPATRAGQFTAGEQP